MCVCGVMGRHSGPIELFLLLHSPEGLCVCGGGGGGRLHQTPGAWLPVRKNTAAYTTF